PVRVRGPEERGPRGLVTTRDVEAGELLLRVPCELALCSDDDQVRGSAVAALSDTAQLAPHEQLSCLLLEKKAQGRVAPVCIEALPSDFSPGPAWLWTPSELDLLCSPPLKEQALLRGKRASWLAGVVREHWVSHGCGPSAPNEDEVRWALTAITSRAQSFLGEGGTAVAALPPITDLMNHDPRPSKVAFVLADGSYVVVARERHAAGDELTFKYGDHPDSYLLLQYGFQLPESNLFTESLVCVEPLLARFGADSEAMRKCLNSRLLQTDYGGQVAAWQPVGSNLYYAVSSLVTAALGPVTQEETLAEWQRVVQELLGRTLDRIPEGDAGAGGAPGAAAAAAGSAGTGGSPTAAAAAQGGAGAGGAPGA
ncbi:unnamed protein product, partial [Prorocentrum cordatum]